MIFFNRNQRRGPSFRTYTGRMFFPFDPRPEDVCIDDIAHSLSLQCRWAGHTRTFYSIAEHCVRGAQHLRGELALEFLLHDASEAYLLDMPRPLKHWGLFGWLYRKLERRVERAIAEHFSLHYPHCGVVKHIDNRMLATEQRDLFDYARTATDKPFPEQIVAYPSEQAERAFMNRFEALSAR